MPVRVDSESGYRFHDPARLVRARLITPMSRQTSRRRTERAHEEAFVPLGTAEVGIDFAIPLRLTEAGAEPLDLAAGF